MLKYTSSSSIFSSPYVPVQTTCLSVLCFVDQHAGVYFWLFKFEMHCISGGSLHKIHNASCYIYTWIWCVFALYDYSPITQALMPGRQDEFIMNMHTEVWTPNPFQWAKLWMRVSQTDPVWCISCQIGVAVGSECFWPPPVTGTLQGVLWQSEMSERRWMDSPFLRDTEVRNCRHLVLSKSISGQHNTLITVIDAPAGRGCGSVWLQVW